MRPSMMIVLIALAALALTGCGHTAAVHAKPAHTQVYGAHAQRLRLARFVHRAGQSGASFLVPAAMDFSYVDLVSDPVAFGDTTSSLNHIDATVAATIKAPDRVELLVDGTPGTLSRVGWVETCGLAPDGTSAAGGGGAGSRVTALIPAVIKLALPHWSTGSDQCRVGVMLYTRARTPASLALVNY